MPTNQDACDLLDTMIDRLDKMSPEQLAEIQKRAQAIPFDPNKPIDEKKLEERITAWRQKEADRLFNE